MAELCKDLDTTAAITTAATSPAAEPAPRTEPARAAPAGEEGASLAPPPQLPSTACPRISSRFCAKRTVNPSRRRAATTRACPRPEACPSLISTICTRRPASSGARSASPSTATSRSKMCGGSSTRAISRFARPRRSNCRVMSPSRRRPTSRPIRARGSSTGPCRQRRRTQGAVAGRLPQSQLCRTRAE